MATFRIEIKEYGNTGRAKIAITDPASPSAAR
jgi:hypothetical protein